jgi:hypothetical protein
MKPIIIAQHPTNTDNKYQDKQHYTPPPNDGDITQEAHGS